MFIVLTLEVWATEQAWNLHQRVTVSALDNKHYRRRNLLTHAVNTTDIYDISATTYIH